ncbi:MAG: nicotinate-nucleotide adenylyltransferase [Wenzhouxiangella sp.]|nr:MAG: nicotinate-nucleotide adenylyltransferase [Wenzhouxiangella sp.]
MSHRVRRSIRNRAVAIFGGTFDPVHYGHLRAAAEISERLKVSDFRLIPAGCPPHRDGSWADPFHRLAMLELAVAAYPDLHVDEREVRRNGRSYMVDTLESVRAEVGDVPMLLCVGQDAANQLDRWHRWQELLRLAHLVVMTRPRSEPRYPQRLGQVLEASRVKRARDLMRSPAGLVCHVEVTQLAISSTDIRNQLGRGWDPRFLLPDTVLSYIRKHGLYGTAETGAAKG